MTAILVAVGMVLDFGIVRLDRQGNKATADLASAGGIKAIQGADGSAKPWRGVCQALAYLQVNDHATELDDLSGAWKTGDGTAVSGDPCDPVSPLLNANCVPGTPSSWAWYSGTAAGGRINVDIKSGYRVSDGAWQEEALIAGDEGDPAQDGCDQLAVLIRETRAPGFGSLATSSDLVTHIRSVGRVVMGSSGDAAVALLLLEQHSCLALDIQGSTGASVLVRGAGDRPGMIHSDSLGDGSLCSSTDKIMDGDFASPPRIWAEDAETGTPLAAGTIGIVALTGAAGAVPGNAHDPSPSTVFAEGQPGGAPIGRDRITRRPVDARYRLPVRSAVDEARALWNNPPPAGYTVLTDCEPPSGSSTAATLVYVDCPAGVKYKAFTFSGNGATVVFNGPVTVEGTGARLTFDDPREVYIKGSTTGEGLRVAKGLRLNTGGQASCADRFAADRTARARVVIGSGPIVAQGEAAVTMCQTAVVVADDNGSCTIPATNGLNPYDNTCRGYVDIRGSGGLDWSAPNAVGAGATQADWNELEDLALWTETQGSSAQNRVEGNGLLNMTGVFFLPNATPFRVAGQGNQDIGENAQFITRRLEVAGNGRLNMQPDADDVVTIPYFGDSFLVR